MNQILITKNSEKKSYNYLYSNYSFDYTKIQKQKKYFYIFLISIIICIIAMIYLFFSSYYRLKELNKTNILKQKYNVIKLYSTNTNYTAIKISENITIIGSIEIPKINLSYPILDTSSKELLKISVCRFSGPLPNRLGNLCIAGHNYKNNSMFSKLNFLNIGDSIFITDINNTKLEYIIYNKEKVKEDNINCIKNTNPIEVTLITCNDINNRERIVLKAKVRE